MNDDQLLRYSRHILLDEIGIEGQEKFRRAQVLVVGVGGLGSPASLYLAASGIGTITLVDGDTVDLTNLQRQVVHGTPDIGRAKVESAAAALRRQNPDVHVVARAERADADLLSRLIPTMDVVLDCTDNFATRHAINRACVVAGVPLVSGAALRFEGQIASFDLRRTGDAFDRAPCYACLFPESDEAEETTCSTMGVFAPLTGIIGSMQAAETLKMIAGLPTLSGRLLMFDAKGADWHAVALSPDPSCPVCASQVRCDWRDR